MEESFDQKEIGQEIEKAVEKALQEGRTVDIKQEGIKTFSTEEMGDKIAEFLKNELKQ